MPPGRRSRYDDDDDDEYDPRPRRSRRGREPRGLSSGAWAAIIGGVAIAVVVVVAAVVIARRGGSGSNPDGTPIDAGLFGGRPSGPPIDSEGFNKISKKDTLATLEARYGRPTRLSNAELETITFSGPSPVDRRFRVRESLKKMIDKRGVSNPECYRWQWANATLYVAMKPNDPKQNLLLKIYVRSGPDENGNTHNEMGLSDFGGEPD